MLQPSHPELLDALAGDFRKSNHSVKHVLRTICRSNAYQLSARYDGEWSDRLIPYFARKYPRRLKAEELHDAIVKATNMPPNPLFEVQFKTEKFPWAMQLPDPTEPRNNGTSRAFLDLFLRGNRDSVPRSDATSLTQELNMMNNTFITSRVSRNGTTTVALLLKTNSTPVDLVGEIYLATLSRRPTPEEQASAVKYISRGTLAQKL